MSAVVMNTVSYSAGDNHLVVVGHRVALSSDAALVGRLWPELMAGTPTDTVLDSLLRSGLGSLADLVVLDAVLLDAVLLDAADSALRLLVRGPHQVHLEHAGGQREVVSAADVATWVDRVVPMPASVRVGPVAAVGGLPLGLGIVLAGGFRWSLTSAGGNESPAVLPKRSAPVAPAPVLVTSVPAAPVPDAVPQIVVPRALGETRAEPAEAAFDHLFGSTVMRSVEDAAVRDPSDPGLLDAGPLDTAVVDALRPGDHDGSTIMKADLDPARPAVLIRRGPSDAGIIARLLLSTGEVIEVLDNAGVVLGRRPQVDRVTGAALPLMVTVPSPNSDISRSHLRLDAVGGRLTATDLRSTNGTVLTEVDGTATHLIAGQRRAVRAGDVLAVGDGITVTVLEPA